MSFPSAIAILLALAFIWAGILNVVGPYFVRKEFNGWGYPPAMRIAVGVVEWMAAGLLLYPATSRFGAAIAIAVLVGVLFSLLRSRAWMRVDYPGMLIALSMLILAYS